MANGSKLAGASPVHMMIAAEPGSGKSGGLASLLNAGFQLRILDYDGNLAPLWNFSSQDRWHDVDAVHLTDKMRIGTAFIEPVSIPTAFATGLNLMDQWKYKDEDGTEVDLGKSKDWDNTVVVVLDSLTNQGNSAMKRVQKLMGKTVLNTTQQTWYVAAEEQLQFVKKLMSPGNRFHVIVMAHTRVVAPKEILKDDPDLNKEIKSETADIVPTRMWPRAIGRELPQVIGGEFPILLGMESVVKGDKVQRFFRTVPTESMTLKLPTNKLPSRLDIDKGLLQVFEALSPASVAAAKARLTNKVM